MGIGPSTKETSLPHFRDPLLEVVSSDPEIDLMGVIIVGTPDADVVSSDLRGDPHTCIVDKRAGIMLGDDFVKLIAWYDNEWGYSSKVLDMVEYVADK